ncbi:scoulerine-9-O-methyltransferase 3-like [Tripterygium wilfordii]|uniref:scoulerine-9-O-methyltransferase 3-like n=1 Tax=Tripterygium wilfordii TaxID=458696 RepID=UPI0018F8316C|nr:scoulerine-9-O-methyltransferase 3-like [Tripterygium wilfordii]
MDLEIDIGYGRDLEIRETKRLAMAMVEILKSCEWLWADGVHDVEFTPGTDMMTRHYVFCLVPQVNRVLEIDLMVPHYYRLPTTMIRVRLWVLHDWDDDRCIKILRNCWKALPENGKVIVMKFAVSKNCNESVHTTFMELMMMVLNLGGKERMTIELDWLAKAAGKCKSLPINMMLCICSPWPHIANASQLSSRPHFIFFVLALFPVIIYADVLI